ncbi:MAG: hypothetical protein ACE5GU_05560 [Candidatus Scalinduaceae bacterium]
MVRLRGIPSIIILLLLVGCTYSPYRYSFSLIDPYVEGLHYEDKDVSFQFTPTAEYIWVSIYNRSEDNIYFVEDEAEYIDTWGKPHSILFGWGYASAMKDFMRDDLYLSPIKIAPKSASEGNIWINVWPGADIGEGWTTVKDIEIDYLDHSMLPEYAFQGDGMTLKGSTFYLKLPVSFDGYKRDYEFTFMITDVKALGPK